MTGNELEYDKISRMSESELLDYVLGAPYLLTDPYYRGFDAAIYARHEALRKETK